MSSSGSNLENFVIPLEEINHATENFSEQRRIGSGGFGVVYKGQLSERWHNRTVAIKRRDQLSYQGDHEFRNELDMISKFHHENIISFIGYCDEDKEMIIVYEYAVNGSLEHHLQDPNKMCCITWTQRLNICIGAARALNYLHSGLGEHKRVIHRDVKSGNILLDGNFVAKICDFGLSKSGPRNQPDTQIYTNVAGTKYYMDPTYHESHILQKESDIYSFGVVLFEILSGMLVYSERRIGGEREFLMNSVRRYHQTEQDKLIDPYIRDQVDSRSFDTFQEIAYGCISFNLMERPTLDSVIKKIEEALIIQTSERSASIPVKRHIVESLLRKLNSSSPYDQRTAVSEIRLLSKINAANRNIFAGAIPLLTNLLTAPDSKTQEQTMTALLNLSICKDNKVRIMSAGAVHGIIQLLKEGSMEARENAAATLFSLSINNKNKVTIGAAEAIPPLVSLLSEGTLRGKKDAANALLTLCLCHGNRGRAVRAGVVPILMEHLKAPDGLLKDKALVNLVLLSTHPEGKLAICNTEVVPVLVEVIRSGSPNNKEIAASFLLELCSSDIKYLVEAQQHGVIRNLTDLLKHGRDKGNEKAGQLLEKKEDYDQDGVVGNVSDLLDYGTDLGQDKVAQMLENIEDNPDDNYRCDSEIIGADRKRDRLYRLLKNFGNLKYAMFNIVDGDPGSSSDNVKSKDEEYAEINLDKWLEAKMARLADVKDLEMILNTTELDNRSLVRNAYEELKRLTHIEKVRHLLEKIKDHGQDGVVGNVTDLLDYTNMGQDKDAKMLEHIEDHPDDNYRCESEIIGGNRKRDRLYRLLKKIGNLKDATFNIADGDQGSSSNNVKPNDYEYAEINLDKWVEGKMASLADVEDLELILNTTELENRSSSHSLVVRNMYEELKRLTHISR